mgnify:CR=1 FL=1
MANEAAVILKLAAWIGRSLGQSAGILDPFDARRIGVALPDAVLNSQAVTRASDLLGTASDDLEASAQALLTAAEGGDEGALLTALGQFAGALVAWFQSLDDLNDAVIGALTPANIPNAAERAAAQAALSDLPKSLADLLLTETATGVRPEIGVALRLLGLLDWDIVPADPGVANSRPFVMKKFRFDRLPDLFSDPADHFQKAFGWGAPGFDPTPFFELFRDFTRDEGAIDLGTIAGDPFYRVGDVTFRRDSSFAPSPPGLRIEYNRSVSARNEARLDLTEGWGLTFGSELSFDAGAHFTIRPPFDVSLGGSAGPIQGDLSLTFNRNPGSGAFEIVGGTDLVRLSVEDIVAAIGTTATWDPGTGTAGIEPTAKFGVVGGRLEIGSEEADGFIAKLLGAAQIAGDFDIELFLSPAQGLQVTGGGGVDISLPMHQSLGPLEFQSLFIRLGIGGDGAMKLETSAGLKAELGPLTAVVERVGAEITLRIAEDTAADFGIFDLDLGFKPPNAVGLSIDAGAVVGGGFLSFDPDRGEYAGMLELSILEIINVTAIGIINTKLPDGSKGFSFLAIISVEFNPGIQLGFGFTLLGVGGLVGLNRSMDLDALAEGARTGSLDVILFPKDIIANASRIISDLRSFFPPEEGTFLIGPMTKFGWGTPTLISLSLGIIIEIPGNVAIVGKLTVAVPDEKIPLIIINVAFIGAIEFDKKRGWFFAAIYDSRVIYITLEGGIGVLAAFGDDSNFIVTVGGFHPSYNPPSLPFPDVPRIAINILNTPVAKIIVKAYFAVTSNTVQFGASAELYFGVSIAKIEGHIAFDALFQFSPFYFTISISASLSVKLFGAGLFSVRFRGTLEGTSPWHVEGTGSISLLFWDVSVDFSHTWGEKENTKLPPISAMPLLAAEFAKVENWTAKLEAANSLPVTLRPVDASTDLVLHPVGSLSITQRAVPLGLTIDKIGSQKPDDANRFTISVTTVGLQTRDSIDESFAIGQFQELADNKKLGASDFQKEEAGIELSVAGTQSRTSFVAKRVARYEQIIIDNRFLFFVISLGALVQGLFAHFLYGNAVARAPLSVRSQDRKHLLDEKITVAQNAFVVANVADNTRFDGAPVSFVSRARAEEYIAQAAKTDPGITKRAHILGAHEMQEAA